MEVRRIQNVKSEIQEDVWVHTQCARCYNACGIRAHRVNGVAVEIQGVPGSTLGSSGGLCPKGLSSLQQLYDPNRLKVPPRRTNPKKGIGVDPKWKGITWEETYDEIVPRMKKILEEDPKILIFTATGSAYPGRPIARGKGTKLDNLLPMDFEHIDPVCGTIETSVRVSIKKLDKNNS